MNLFIKARNVQFLICICSLSDSYLLPKTQPSFLIAQKYLHLKKYCLVTSLNTKQFLMHGCIQTPDLPEASLTV